MFTLFNAWFSGRGRVSGCHSAVSIGWVGALRTLRDCVCCFPFLRYLGSKISEENRGVLVTLEEKAAGLEVID
jgi:hypothetical protein